MVEQVKLEGGLDKAAAELQMPASPILMYEVAKHGQNVLKERMQLSHLPEPASRPTERIMRNRTFFQNNNLICAAYLKSSRILEVFPSLCVSACLMHAAGGLLCNTSSILI